MDSSFLMALAWVAIVYGILLLVTGSLISQCPGCLGPVQGAINLDTVPQNSTLNVFTLFDKTICIGDELTFPYSGGSGTFEAEFVSSEPFRIVYSLNENTTTLITSSANVTFPITPQDVVVCTVFPVSCANADLTINWTVS